MYHVLGIDLHMKQKFSECLTKRHRSTAEYFYFVTQSAVESEDAERGFRTLSGDFEQVTRPQNKSHDVIDMDRSPPVELQKCHESNWSPHVHTGSRGTCRKILV
jgi:hypothetical protein